MSRQVLRRRRVVVVCGLTTLLLAGCWGRNVLPSTVIIELPDGSTVEVDEGGGAESLANTAWQFFRGSGIFLTIRFGPDGNLAAFENNTIAPEIFGSTILFDGDVHDTAQGGFTYVASTYGAETSDGTGFSFEGRLAVFVAGIQAGSATATATGTFDPDDPDTMTGTFAYSTELTLPFEIPGAEQEAEFEFIAHRVE